MPERVCEGCNTQPLRDNRMLCRPCATELSETLGRLPELAGELETTFTRQSRRSHNRITPNRSAIIYDLYPAILRDDMMALVQRWVGVMFHGDPASWPVPEWFQPMCRLLADSLPLLVGRDEVPRMHREITDMAVKVTRAVDLPPDRVYAGVCSDECDTSLYAEPGASMVQCPTCERGHDVDHRRQQMLDAVSDRLVTAAEAAMLVVYLGDMGARRERVRKLVNQWHVRGRLVPRLGGPEPRFAFGEILNLLARWQADGTVDKRYRRRQRKRRRRGAAS